MVTRTVELHFNKQDAFSGRDTIYVVLTASGLWAHGQDWATRWWYVPGGLKGIHKVSWYGLSNYPGGRIIKIKRGVPEKVEKVLSRYGWMFTCPISHTVSNNRALGVNDYIDVPDGNENG